jgi:2-amino-4,5-dihydroxy-6-oxo-7-(phosphooxy)heptanoate synthase
MPGSDPLGRQVRRNRLYRHGGDRLLMVPIDHPVSDGPVVPAGGLDRLVGLLADNGADAVVLHKGAARRVSPHRFTTMSLLVQLSAGISDAADPHGRCLVSTVEEAIRLGADGVTVHVNLGSAQELRQLADLAEVAGACDRWNMPLLAMVYPRGPRVTDPLAPRMLAHAVAVAAELGADLVKTAYPGSVAAMAEVVAASPIPVLVAGGPADEADIVARVGDALAGGAAGAAIGRHVFRATDPAAITRKLSELVHGRFEEVGAGSAGPAGRTGGQPDGQSDGQPGGRA